MRHNNIKKVYADYHGPRCTREIDGEVGHWKFSGFAARSAVKDTYVNWNPDLINEDGKHDIAAMSYPLVGMQSQSDPDYIEYQILLAKTAHIDGFFVEWGFPEHRSNEEVSNIMKVAKKYDFEIGINWCDAWHFYDWIEKFHPEIKERHDKVDIFKESLQYLIDNVFNSSTGVLYDGHPIIFMFGGGPTVDEFKEILSHKYCIPEDMKEPWFFSRAVIDGKEEKSKVEYKYNFTQWSEVMDGTFGWIPTRVRKGKNSKYDKWDRYATKEDALNYLDAMIQQFRENKDKFKLRISVVNPEMDNRACASWGKFDLSHIPRENGKTFESMWDYNVKNKDDIDIVYVVSWNDYTERHQIEPTTVDGNREIRTTEKYAAQFKQIKSDSSGINLPLKLFELRKKAKFLKMTGFEVNSLKSILNKAGIFISKQKYNEATDLFNEADKIVNDMECKISFKQYVLKASSDKINVHYSKEENNISIVFDESIAKELRENNFDGYLSFKYLDNDNDSFKVLTDTQRTGNANGDYSVVCDIKKNKTNKWVDAKVKLYKTNTAFTHKLQDKWDFIFKDNVKDICFNFKLFKIK